MTISPVFLFSAPRSGSTLLQRILTTHKHISSTSETWLLLPQIYAFKRRGVYTEYAHTSSVTALEDFIACLPNGKGDYLSQVSKFARSLYALAADTDAMYFLDKTPRYNLIIPEIVELFPDAKYIYLFRNPVAVLASIISTWGKGTLKRYHNNIDLFIGSPLLVDSFIRFKDRSHAVRYEDLIGDPQRTVEDICKYLCIEPDQRMLVDFSKTELKGRMGDPIGTRMYSYVSKDPVVKWHSIMSNPYRKSFCRRYLKFLGCERLQVMGYNINELLNEINRIPLRSNYLLSDLFAEVYGLAHSVLELSIMKDRILHSKIKVISHR